MGKVHDLSLIPRAEQYYQNGLNVLLISDHGVGKTALVTALADKLGISMKYFSAATMDPFTDLVGVPFPKEVSVEGEATASTGGTTRASETVRVLEMVRPRDVDNAELIFFDELNRADPRVLAAVFELIQFRSINGEKLPKLKAVWAAINPPNSDKEYEVETLDPALVDRFDVYEELKPKPSVKYMKQNMSVEVAEVLVDWWKNHEKGRRGETSYISPRRLEKIGVAVTRLGTTSVVKKLLPPGGVYDWKVLQDNLGEALTGVIQLRYDLSWLSENIITFRKAVRKTPDAVNFVKLANLYATKSTSDMFNDPVHVEILGHIPTSFLENTVYVKKKKDMIELVTMHPETSAGVAAGNYFKAKGVRVDKADKNASLFVNKNGKDLVALALHNPEVAVKVCKSNTKIRAATAQAFVGARINDADIVLHLAPLFETFTENEVRKIVDGWNVSKKSQIRNMFREPSRVTWAKPNMRLTDVSYVKNYTYGKKLRDALGGV